MQPSAENPYAFLLAKQAVESLGEYVGHADGLETDSSGYIYVGSQGMLVLLQHEWRDAHGG